MEGYLHIYNKGYLQILSPIVSEMVISAECRYRHQCFFSTFQVVNQCSTIYGTFLDKTILDKIIKDKHIADKTILDKKILDKKF